MGVAKTGLIEKPLKQLLKNPRAIGYKMNKRFFKKT
jgi:hypothetical protein